MGEYKLLLANVDKPDSEKLETYKAAGGYERLRKALFDMKPDEIVEEVKKSGLRGRGGAGFPTGLKWSFVPKTDEPKYLVCNADEGEPGTFKDRVIIEKDPHLLLEGVAISAYAIGAHEAFIYIRGEYEYGAQVLERAIKEAEEAGVLGKNALRSGYDIKITVHRGAGAYVCGEETALLNSLEGRRGHPRIRPPFPASKGLYQHPTVINNVETLATVPFIVEKGGDWYASLGTEKSKGTKLFSISGHVKRPGVYELELGTPFEELIYNIAGGIREGHKLKAVIPGGSSTPMLKAEEIEGVLLDYESLQAAGSMLGSGAVIVMDDSTCIVKAVYRMAKFYAHESCGQCTPCREGTRWMVQILTRILNGKGRMEDLDVLLSMKDIMGGNCLCPLGDAALGPLITGVTKFRDEFEAHIKTGRCPLGG
ncbi:NADH-quinone oxidoreductase subunit F [Thermosulfidibacter takaii ABI70S6]|uniref:NADH-quinone oxidoreductase subunit F n=1 Tax=Thermosulfidibacter takaii (strain DSM 17441 / JCM 13301 / NBRC 103674 / ABI70S6) TaxID=1298851 RepID=A0A0S3QRP6_THET7|nr:NADH-quinone oxidoreductase subunit NuoF [Thermosulfidibacter takaii]BAT71012.1 NADH-quinone oxidoreductase subunit F [Thermosulfidibacter takaii ABI70S6]